MMNSTNSTKFTNPGDVEEFLNSDEFATGFGEYVSSIVSEWVSSNPESALTLGRNIQRGLSAFAEAVGEMLPVLRVLLSEQSAETYRRRYEEEGDAILYTDAVDLAFYLMALRFPYTGQDRPPGGNISTIRDYELLAVEALSGDRLSDVVKESSTSVLHFHALQTALRHLRETREPVPEKLHEWALDVADGTRQPPTPGPGRPPANQVRNDLIIRTIQKLVDCGLNATRNDASDPESACDAVSEALKRHMICLKYRGVVGVWDDR